MTEGLYGLISWERQEMNKDVITCSDILGGNNEDCTRGLSQVL